MAFTINKITNNKYWWGCGEKGTLIHYWWRCKSVQQAQKTLQSLLKKLKQLLYDLVIPFLSIYPKTPIKKKTIIQKVICTPMFIVVLHRIAKIWQQPKYPSADKENEAYIPNGILFSHKKWNLATCDNMDGFWDSIWSHFYVKSENKTKDKI